MDSETPTSAVYYFAIVGFPHDLEVFDAKNNIHIRKINVSGVVVHPPTDPHDLIIYGYCCQWQLFIGHELRLEADPSLDYNVVTEIVHNFFRGIRIASNAEFIVPLVSTTSWEKYLNNVVIPPRDDMMIDIFEYFPYIGKYSEHESEPTQEQLLWATENFMNIFEGS